MSNQIYIRYPDINNTVAISDRTEQKPGSVLNKGQIASSPWYQQRKRTDPLEVIIAINFLFQKTSQFDKSIVSTYKYSVKICTI